MYIREKPRLQNIWIYVKSIVQVLCIWESHTLDWTVYISRWLFWSKGLLWRSAYIWLEDRKTDVIVHPSILGVCFMKKSFYFAWRQENFVHPSLMCNNFSLMKMYRCSVGKCIDVQLNTCSRCYVVIETCTQNFLNTKMQLVLFKIMVLLLLNHIFCCSSVWSKITSFFSL